MIFRLVGMAILASGLASAAIAQTGVISGAYIGCLTDEYLSQLMSAISTSDMRLRDSLMGSACVVVKGYEYSMLDRGVLRSKIRVYVGDDYVDLIVPAEAAQ